VSAPRECQLIGRWRIVAADLWERDYLDLCGPAMLDIRTDGSGEIAFGALQASLDLAYGCQDVSFDWEGDDDMHEVRGSGAAELLDDGSLEIEFDYRNGDHAILKAQRVNSSAACSHDRCQPVVHGYFSGEAGHRAMWMRRVGDGTEDDG
jgi:hypothetical protein